MPKLIGEAYGSAAMPRRGLFALALAGLALAALAACKTTTGPTPAANRRGHDGGPGGN